MSKKKEKFVYCVFKNSPSYWELLEIYADKATADKSARMLMDILHEEDLPEYDEWGIISGTEYRVVKKQLK